MTSLIITPLVIIAWLALSVLAIRMWDVCLNDNAYSGDKFIVFIFCMIFGPIAFVMIIITIVLGHILYERSKVNDFLFPSKAMKEKEQAEKDAQFDSLITDSYNLFYAASGLDESDSSYKILMNASLDKFTEAEKLKSRTDAKTVLMKLCRDNPWNSVVTPAQPGTEPKPNPVYPPWLDYNSGYAYLKYLDIGQGFPRGATQ